MVILIFRPGRLSTEADCRLGLRETKQPGICALSLGVHGPRVDNVIIRGVCLKTVQHS